MTDEQKAAYVIAMAACVTARVAGMQAANQQCQIQGESPAYDVEHFNALLDEYGVHHNSVLTLYRG